MFLYYKARVAREGHPLFLPTCTAKLLRFTSGRFSNLLPSTLHRVLVSKVRHNSNILYCKIWILWILSLYLHTYFGDNCCHDINSSSWFYIKIFFA